MTTKEEQFAAIMKNLDKTVTDQTHEEMQDIIRSLKNELTDVARSHGINYNEPNQDFTFTKTQDEAKLVNEDMFTE